MKISISNSNVLLLMVMALPFLPKAAIGALLILFVFISIPIVYNKWNKLDRAEITTLFFMAACSLISVILAQEILVAFRETILYLSVVLWVICISCYCSAGRVSTNSILKAYFCSCIIISILYLCAYFSRASFLSWVLNLELVKTNNHFCYYVGGAIVIGLVDFFLQHRLKYFILSGVCLAVVVVCTGRGLLVTLAIVLTIAVLILSERSNLAKLAVILFIVTILVWIFFFFDSLPNMKIYKLFNPQSSFSNRERFALWTSSLEMVRDHPFGVGAGNWVFEYLEGGYRSTKNVYPHTHNVYIQTLCELGVQGLVAFVGMLFVCYKRLRRSIRVHGFKHENTTLLLLLLYSLVSFMFNNPLNNNKPLLMFYLILGLAFSMKVQDHDEKNNLKMYGEKIW